MTAVKDGTRPHYAGIGSRETPDHILELMTKIASILEVEGWVLRSGGADGADSAFDRGVKSASNKEIFLPSPYFNGKSYRHPGYLHAPELPGYREASRTVAMFHPAPDRLSEYAHKLMARNAMQVLGPDLDTPSRVVVAWTKNGQITGGTGQALRIASASNIPIFNLGVKSLETSIRGWFDGGTSQAPLSQSVLALSSRFGQP
jgi:hypothetical protein